MARRKSDPADAGTPPTEAGDAAPKTDDSATAAGTGTPPSGFPSDPPDAPAEVPPPAIEPEVGSDSHPDPGPVRAEPRPFADEIHDTHDPAAAEEDEPGYSLAARALAVLLLLLAGAAAGIWAAPHLAPMLPAGLAPVAEWLTPGAREAQTDYAALEARVESELAATGQRIAALPGAEDIDARIASAVAAAGTQTSADLGALRETVGEIDPAGIRQRIDQLAATLDGQAAELATLKDQLTGGVAATSSLTEEAVARIDVYRAELDGLRAELSTLTGNVSGLASRIDAVAATADRSIAAAQDRVAAIEAESSTALDVAHSTSDIALLRAALTSGQPFADVADRLTASPGVTLPEGLAAAAATGAPTLATLRADFPDAAHAAIRATILAGAGDGIVARARAFVGAQVASRSLTPQPGMTPDAILSRMEDDLRRDDLEGVLAEAGHLPSEASAAMANWLAGVRLRVAAEAGLAEISAQLPVTN
jgi:hypothetical protein